MEIGNRGGELVLNLEPAWWAGVDLIRWVQQFRRPWLDSLFLLFTALHSESFYVLAIGATYWCVDRRLGARLAALILPNIWLNSALKWAFGLPRPDPAQVVVLVPHADPGLPSGHAQGSLTFWGYLARRHGTRAAWAAAAALVWAISLSRIYLGVHFPGDVLAGWGIGAAYLAVAVRFERAWDAMPAARRTALALVLPALAGAAMMGIHRAGETAAVVGGFIGVATGDAVGSRLWPASARGAWWRQVAKIAGGVAALMVLRIGLKALLPAGFGSDIIRYALIGAAATAALPWLFLRVGLAEREPPRE